MDRHFGQPQVEPDAVRPPGHCPFLHTTFESNAMTTESTGLIFGCLDCDFDAFDGRVRGDHALKF